ncbi:MAG: NFACT family protein, partial [Clostridia bacterium]|nr:NFACT family protein [Clostridia bacterium]
MAFDAGILSHIASEMRQTLVGGRIEKIHQPQKNEILLTVRCAGESRKILIDVGSSNARINITSMKIDNPATPPMFCMMLRKHFSGAKISGIEQMGFERALR